MLLTEQSAPHLRITQDLGLGMMLWMTQLTLRPFAIRRFGTSTIGCRFASPHFRSICDLREAGSAPALGRALVLRTKQLKNAREAYKGPPLDAQLNSVDLKRAGRPIRR